MSEASRPSAKRPRDAPTATKPTRSSTNRGDPPDHGTSAGGDRAPFATNAWIWPPINATSSPWTPTTTCPRPNESPPAGTRAVVGEPDDDGYVEVEREPPLLVFADYEAITDAKGVQTAILIGYETVESDDTVLLYGSSRRWTTWPSTAKGTTDASSSSSTTSKATTAYFSSSISTACIERSRIRSPWAPRSCPSPPIASPSRTLSVSYRFLSRPSPPRLDSRNCARGSSRISSM